jgi:IS1 family transposase
MECKFCKEECQRAGRQRNGTQKLYCRSCKKYQQQEYKYAACDSKIDQQIATLVCESVSIRGIARILKIALATVIKKIKLIAAKVIKPPIPLNCKVLELDEVRTFIKKKENQYWVAYAICSETKKVIDFVIGRRTKRTLKMIVNTLLLSNAETIKTDKLNIYQSLIPEQIHQSAAYNINSIERNNLNLRTHLKRLSRKTICFSRSLLMLECCLKIYFWSID